VESRCAKTLRWLRSGAVALAALALSACSVANESSVDGEPVPDQTTNEQGTAISGLSGSEPAACAALAETAQRSYRPIDVVFLIDNSASMDDEIAAVERSINRDFANIMEQSGLDYRVIMISRYGAPGAAVGNSDNPICIGAPLSPDACDSDASEPRNGARFFHYSANVQSHDGWCVLLDSFEQPDEFGDVARPGWATLAAHGWSAYLRPEAFKTFVAISDDDVDCRAGTRSFSDHSTASGGEIAAQAFDTALLQLSPKQFGTAKSRNYVWHSIVGLRAFSASTSAWAASAPIETGVCGNGALGPGTGYQALSRLTQGLRYPSCDPDHLDTVFNTIAHGIVGTARIDCQWQIPEPKAGESFDHGRVNVRYVPSGGASTLNIGHVPDARHCAAGGWYYDNPEAPQNISVCPSTCAVLQRDASARVDVLFGCATDTLVR
jgi:hypothetical protein